MILCEKPLSMDLVEGQKMVDAVEKAGVPTPSGTTTGGSPP